MKLQKPINLVALKTLQELSKPGDIIYRIFPALPTFYIEVFFDIKKSCNFS